MFYASPTNIKLFNSIPKLTFCVYRRRKRRKAERRSMGASLGVRASRSLTWALASGRWCATRRMTGNDWPTNWRTLKTKMSEPCTLCSQRTSCRKYRGSSRRRSGCSGESSDFFCWIIPDFLRFQLILINK